MTRTNLVFTMAMVLALGVTVAQAGQNDRGHGYQVAAFVDENGDGFNDLAPDADGDGIPNGLDSDYEPPRDGSGAGLGWRAGDPLGQGNGPRVMASWGFHPFLMFGPFGAFALEAPGNGHGPADGTGFGGNGPADGGGYGPGTGTGAGDCDGTGPNGQQGGPNDRGNRR
ncbi:MAG: hypothetical protein KC729_21605 [Candidatus Eisenbacteria bacterium]|uniref:Uncharacterized protein n=1 Tax=Eiseniibacteriota bacterium TaxID=2212470 RepID=A0A956M3Y3_UNCEI|nr:hypothetical protein [Candidatus Eisenbacteria bacterium]